MAKKTEFEWTTDRSGTPRQAGHFLLAAQRRRNRAYGLAMQNVPGYRGV